MHPRTWATFRELANQDWFLNVGQRDTNCARVLDSWEEAIESCRSPEWEDLCQEAVNQFCARLVERDRVQFNQWNTRLAEVKTVVVPMVEEKTRTIVDRFGLPSEFIDSVQWDMLHLGMEAEYSDVFPPAFFASQAYWYVKGHFPCGWEGVFPEGRLIIF